MRDNNVDFLSKFGERVEKIGKNGVMGIIQKLSGPSINHNSILNKELFNRDFNKNLIFNKNNSSILNNLNIYPKYSNNPRNSHLPINLFMEPDKNRKSNSLNNNYRNNKQPLIYSCHINRVNNLFNNEDNNYYNSRNKYEIGDNKQKIFDYGYKPYTIKDFKKLDNHIDRGKLGPNFMTKEWKEKKERMKKMSDYGKQIMIKGKENHLKYNENELYGEKIKDSDEINNEDEKFNYINEYSEEKDYNINNKLIRNVNKKSNYISYFDKKEEYGQSIDNILKRHVNINYRRRINKFKNILF